MSKESIIVKGARQNNLKNLDIELPTNELIVVTGVSGSGKSTLAFDTIYAEGQRRYVETFSAYARQFLDRMDKPAVDSIQGIPPAIAIDQTNQVRTSRSTVGTMTELNDYLKLLFARMAQLYCTGCGREVISDSAQSIVDSLYKQLSDSQRVMLCLPIKIPHNFTEDEIVKLLHQQGYTRIHQRHDGLLEVIQDRFKLNEENRDRLTEAVEASLKHANGRLHVFPLDENKKAGKAIRFSNHHHCPDCDIEYSKPVPSLFSFNSPIGACESCKGFGRIIGVDYGLVIPDETKSLEEGAIKPIQTPSYIDVQDELISFAKKKKIPVDKAWNKLTKKQQRWVIEGEGDWDDGVWFGLQRFFKWLESKSYKMHIRVLLSKYRSYTPCGTCDGARLKAPALWWRVGSLELSNKVINVEQRYVPKGLSLSVDAIRQLPGLTIHDVMHLPLSQCSEFFKLIKLPKAFDEAAQLLLSEIRSRLNYLLEVGLGYLTLDRQSRTLSGGEVQRINLTTALGTSLVNTLFVLDEPSIGLHPRDINQLVKVLHRLRDAGNTLLVVEHDPQVMLAADRILDIGPGPGKLGGEICFYGTPKQLLRDKKSLTAAYLSGNKSISLPANEIKEENADYKIVEQLKTESIQIIGATEHNLKNIDVTIPLHQLVCITGVSGSGKSTLMRDVLYPWICKHKGKSVETPGLCKKISGHKNIDDVVLVDQSPIGKTTRSIPATYVGAFDAIRKLFIKQPLAKERNYTPGTFSFNSGNGRCPTCSGNGFEMIEMQFLSDVYVRCPDCDGKRYRDEILQVKVLGDVALNGKQSTTEARSIADILKMTVSEALLFFAGEADVIKTLQPLVDVGLPYLQLGQAVPTLSGGEAQRLKLAGHLAKNLNRKKSETRNNTKGTLFLFDEPTTGLHFDDIATLMKAFRQLIDAGNSLLVIEHNLDVIRCADWIIDIGPNGGAEGGELVGQGQPQLYAESNNSYTAIALREYEKSFNSSISEALNILPARSSVVKTKQSIQVHNAREHNLKNVDIEIPRNKFTVISGVSGSGKSTVAFDIIFAEGQRRYLESLNAYARQFVQPASRPDVDAIHGIPPTVAIEQRTSRGGRKSTVATLTEIYHYLRLLYVKLGTQYCPDCEVAIEPQSIDAILAMIQKEYRNREVTLLAPLVVARKGIYNELAKWAASKGYQKLRVDGEYVLTDPWPKLARYKEHDIELPLGELKVGVNNEYDLFVLLKQALDMGNGIVIVEPLKKVSGKQKGEALFSTERACPCCGQGFDELDPRLFSYNSKHGWCESCYGTGEVISGFDEEQSGEEGEWLESEENSLIKCKTCEGTRLNNTALSVRFRDKSIAQLAAMSVDESEKWFSKLKLKTNEQVIARDLLKEMSGRLSFLKRVGLNYLTLDRSAPTLSGGEAQRIRLASQLGSNLQGVCYILDEPTIGLHTRDNRRLIETLREIQKQGNTVLVVEHDEDTIREADYLIDMGPGAGIEGGEVVAHGTLNQMMKNKKSLTGQFIKNPLRHPMNNLRDVEKRSHWETEEIKIVDASENNLANIDVLIPLRKLVAVSGVSGSGKSTLIRSVLHGNLKTSINNQRSKAGRNKKNIWSGCKDIKGWDSITRILEVDQTPIGKTPRSCPATYIGIWDTIRKLFADTVDARLKGFKPGRFSFNAGDGRCDACGGHGMRKIEMNFLPDVRVECEVCHGWRFNDETLSVRYKDKHIGEVLGMNVKSATEYFSAIPKVHHALQLLQDVGLGYLTLGQQSPTLSGGEAQRIKLVAELAKANSGSMAKTQQHSLYVLDEPTVGLHMADVEKLLRVLHRLVDAGNSVIVIEHNLDVVAEADWVLDMGPEGGKYGGKVIAQGKPVDICKRKRSHTGIYLSELIEVKH